MEAEEERFFAEVDDIRKAGAKRGERKRAKQTVIRTFIQ